MKGHPFVSMAEAAGAVPLREAPRIEGAMNDVERVAKAICCARRPAGCGAGPFTRYGETTPLCVTCGCGYWDEMKGYAKAAIEEMQKP